MSSTAAPRPKPWETGAPLDEPQRNAQSLSAVSYTHLDVYKRQMLGSGIFKLMELFSEF